LEPIRNGLQRLEKYLQPGRIQTIIAAFKFREAGFGNSKWGDLDAYPIDNMQGTIDDSRDTSKESGNSMTTEQEVLNEELRECSLVGQVTFPPIYQMLKQQSELCEQRGHLVEAEIFSRSAKRIANLVNRAKEYQLPAK